MRVASRPKVETKEVCVPGSPLLQRGDPAPGFGRPANKRVLQSIMPKIFELVGIPWAIIANPVQSTKIITLMHC